MLQKRQSYFSNKSQTWLRGYLLLTTSKTCIKKSMGQMLPHKSSSHTQTHEKSQASPNTRKPEKLWSIQQKQRGYCPNYHLRIQGILINHCRKERRHLHDQNSISHYYVHTMERKLSTRSLTHPKYGVQGIEIGWLALTNFKNTKVSNEQR